jgi:N-acetylmuramoyl-L-alanine amidase CwlA
VIHWVANPNTSARANRHYFEARKRGNLGFGSSHEIIGLKGEIIICLPETEMAYHVGAKQYTQEAITNLSSYPNNCTYGIEVCHRDWQGRMTRQTIITLIERLAQLCTQWDLDPTKDLYLHHDIVSWKDCPRWWVNHPHDWAALKSLVKAKMADEETCLEFE